MMTNDGELMDYINVPVGKGADPARPLKPLVAVPTTAGTGSESTTVCVLDVLSLKVKTGISHPRLRPTLAVIDPDLTVTQPAGVTAASGMDILCHALESYTARWYTTYDKKQPEQRVPYCGSNPIADMWSEKAMTLLGASFRRAVHHGDDRGARHDMALAATFAGHGLRQRRGAHPARQRLPDRRPGARLPPAGLPRRRADGAARHVGGTDRPEAFRFTFDAGPERHLRAASLLDPSVSSDKGSADTLPAVIIDLMRDIDIPNGIGAVGYAEDDIDDLVEGTLKQQRLLATCPKEVTGEDIAGIFRASLELW